MNPLETRIVADASREGTQDVPRLESIGNYALIEEIARGGMGVVYRARAQDSGRTVAVKMMLGGQFSSDEFVRRFQAEAQAGSTLDHPNIVSIKEVGRHQGHHYLVMEYVDGRNLAELVRERPLPSRRAARYVRILAEAIQYAHEQGILHRDLKPSNILIDSNDEPHITDFGIAKRLGQDADLTLTGQMLGSPSYLPPEQVMGRRGELGPASDVYSLGAILYHLLVGRPVFFAETLEETLLQVLKTDPIPPRLLNPSVPLSLEIICLKCLEKEQARRYASARDLAADLSLFLRGMPIGARRVGWAERSWRWCMRNPLLAALCGMVALLAVATVVGSAVAVLRIGAARNTELAERRRAEEALSQLEIQRSQELFAADNSSVALAYLARVLRQNPINRIALDRLVFALSQRQFPVPAAPILAHRAAVSAGVWSGDGTLVATGDSEGNVRLWEVASGRLVKILGTLPSEARWLRFVSKGEWILAASGNRVYALSGAGTQAVLAEHSAAISSSSVSPDEQWLVTSSYDGSVAVWNTRTRALLMGPLQHESEVYAACFGPTGRRVLSGSADGTARLWQLPNGQELLKLKHAAAVLAVAFSPDGSLLATAAADRQVRVWKESGDLAIPALAVGGSPTAVVFSRNSQHLAAASGAQIKVWELRGTNSPAEARILQHEGRVVSVEFSPDGERLLSSSEEGTARVWDVPSGRPASEPMRHRQALAGARFDPSSRNVLTYASDGAACVWEFGGRQGRWLSMPHEQRVTSARFDGAGDRVLTTSEDSTARLWQARFGRLLLEPLAHEKSVVAGEFSPVGDGSFVTASWDKKARLWSAEGELKKTFEHNLAVVNARFSRDGQRLVTASWDKTARVWDLLSGEPLLPPLKHDGEVSDAEFSADGTRVLTACDDGAAQLWNGLTGVPLGKPMRHGGPVLSARFSQDGKAIVTASADGTARVWDGWTGEPITALLRHQGPIRAAMFDANRQRVVTASEDKTARVWDARTGDPIGEPLRHDAEVISAAFSPDTARIVTASADGSARVWDAHTGQPLSDPMRMGAAVTAASFSLDGRKLLVVAGKRAEVCVIPDVPVPAPAWLPDLAEALAGVKLNSGRVFEPVPREMVLEVRRSILDSSEDEPGIRWGRWFFGGRNLE